MKRRISDASLPGTPALFRAGKPGLGLNVFSHLGVSSLNGDILALYECRQFDEQALHLAEQWVKEYAHE